MDGKRDNKVGKNTTRWNNIPPIRDSYNNKYHQLKFSRGLLLA
jgi:hypothetical protein